MFHFEVTDDSVLPPETPRTARGVGDTLLIPENYAVGDLIYDSEKNIGVVKYIGSVGKYAGSWLGIEWDDASRGKHSGSLDDKEYFQCSKPNAGSFIRAHKANKIQSITEALRVRYGHDEAVFSSLKSIEDRLEKKKISYDQLSTLNLSAKGISDSSEAEVQEIHKLCPNVEALELADNLIKSWSFIGLLCTGYSKLTRIDFSKNPLNDITDEELEKFQDSFSKLDHVVLGGVNLEWSCFLKLSAFWPNISNLQVPFNKIATLIPPTTTLLNVTRIDLEGNKIACWNEVLKLTVMERLQYMNLCGNDIKTIRFPAEIGELHSVHTSFFPNLKILNVTENSIDDWISVGELNKLKKLEELRIDLNPVLNLDSRATNRQMIIARVGQIKKLEGVEINRQERRDSEIDYVKRYCAQWEVEKDSFRFAAENPRYSELVIKWGQSESGETTTVSKTMKSSLISVVLIPQKPSVHKQITKKVVPTMTILKLKGLIQRVFHEDEPPATVTAVSSRNPGITFVLDDDFTDISTYSIEEGDKLLIDW